MAILAKLAIPSLLLLLAFAPTASACHKAPSLTADNACTTWGNPPFGAVPFATGCATAALVDAGALCTYTFEVTDEVLFGCPPNNPFSCSLA